MLIFWIDSNSTRFLQACTDESMFPMLTTAVSSHAEHLNAIVATVSPVEIAVNPVKCKASD